MGGRRRCLDLFLQILVVAAFVCTTAVAAGSLPTTDDVTSPSSKDFFNILGNAQGQGSYTGGNLVPADRWAAAGETTRGDVSQEDADVTLTRPKFEQLIVDSNVTEGYWLSSIDVNGDGKPDLVTSGLTFGKVWWYENPTWKKRLLADLGPGVVSMDHADVDRDGFLDLAVTYAYGGCMFHCGAHDGKVCWLHNPGLTKDGKYDFRPWKLYFIGNRTSSHRAAFGHFTRTDQIELLAIPVIGPAPPGDISSPVQVTLYTPPVKKNELLSAKAWPATIVDDSSFRVVHEIRVQHFGKRSSGDKSSLDSLLVASQEGISWIYYDTDKAAWVVEHLGDGDHTQKGFQGSGGVDVGALDGDEFSFIPALEPFHGNTIAVYSKDIRGKLTNMTWERQVLDIFGTPAADGQSTLHQLRAADFDGDGNSEFVACMRGPMPFQGIVYYKAMQLADDGTWAWFKQKIGDISGAIIQVDDFDGDGRLDFATISYVVPGYYEAAEPRVVIYYNRFGEPDAGQGMPYHPVVTAVQTDAQAAVTVSAQPASGPYPGIKVQFPNPVTAPVSVSPEWRIGGWAFSFVQLRARYKYDLPALAPGARFYIKVFKGSLLDLDSDAPTVAVTAVHQRRSNAVAAGVRCVTAGAQGALFQLFTADASVGRKKIVSMVRGPMNSTAGPLNGQLFWQRYGDIDPVFKGADFWNLRGFLLVDHTGARLLYHQWWAVNNGVNAGYHDHSNTNASTTFGEIHQTLHAGSGHGGMQYQMPAVLNGSKAKMVEVLVPLPVGFEHGPFWHVDGKTGKPLLRSERQISYPMHRWIGGGVKSDPPAYDVWCVFEIPPADGGVDVPVSLLATDIPGAYV